MKARDPMEDLTAVPDSGLGWLDASGDHADIVLSTRVRLARNLQGHAFGPRARVNDREAVKWYMERVAAGTATNWQPNFLVNDDDWMKPYFDPEDRSARCARREYFGGAMAE